MGFLNPSTVEVADSHRKQQLLLGYCITKGSSLAILANTLVVPCGLVILGVQLTGQFWSMQTIIFAAIGCIVAILSDTMTLSSAARVRKAYEAFSDLEHRYSQVLEEERTPAIQKRHEAETKRLKRTMKTNVTFLVFFVLVSGALGDMFWHWTLSALKNDALAWTFSILFSLLVSGTMCAAQLFKMGNDELVHESIASGNYMALALKKDADAKAVSILSKKYATEIAELAENTDVVRAAISEHSETIYDELLSGGKGRIPLRIRQEKESLEYAAKQESELTKQQLVLINGGTPTNLSAIERIRDFMDENPRATNKDIVAAFPDIPANTAKSYATQIRTGKAS